MLTTGSVAIRICYNRQIYFLSRAQWLKLQQLTRGLKGAEQSARAGTFLAREGLMQRRQEQAA